MTGPGHYAEAEDLLAMAKSGVVSLHVRRPPRPRKPPEVTR